MRNKKSRALNDPLSHSPYIGSDLTELVEWLQYRYEQPKKFLSSANFDVSSAIDAILSPPKTLMEYKLQPKVVALNGLGTYDAFTALLQQLSLPGVDQLLAARIQRVPVEVYNVPICVARINSLYEVHWKW